MTLRTSLNRPPEVLQAALAVALSFLEMGKDTGLFSYSIREALDRIEKILSDAPVAEEPKLAEEPKP
jgi:hypothetical protein